MVSFISLNIHHTEKKTMFQTVRILLFFCILYGTLTMVTGYGLDGPGIESKWGQDFPHLSRPALGPTQTPVQQVPGLSRG
jgi:hypothetical protein